MNERFYWEPAGPLTPGQMEASLALMVDVDHRATYNLSELRPFWQSVQQSLQELIDGTVDRADVGQCHPFTIYQSCSEEDWDSIREFKVAFAYEIGWTAGTIADLSGDMKDSMLDALDREEE